MKTENAGLEFIRELLNVNKIATLDQLKVALGTSSTMTVFRKLKALDYLSSYSHRGKYYTLHDIAEFDDLGLWEYDCVMFSQYGNLIETTKEFVDMSSSGFTANELETILHVEVKHPLLKLFKDKRVDRKKVSGSYVYISTQTVNRKRQIINRENQQAQFDIDLSYESETLTHELKAAVILFFSLLNEKQRRLYAGLESYKLGHGGDKSIAQLFAIDAHTVAKGRKELFSQDVEMDRIRKKGAGRRAVEKKSRRLSKK
jgi:hypothetical protein